MSLSLFDARRPGLPTVVPDDVIREYLARATYVTWYDAIETPADTVEVLDLAIPAFLDAVPNFRQLLDGMASDTRERLARIELALRRLGPDRDLAEWVRLSDSLSAQQLLRELFQSATGGANGALVGFGPAKCTKMLHRKRPRLIPIIDSYSRLLWAGASSSAWTTNEMVEITIALGHWLADHEGELETVRGLAVEQWPDLELSDVRLYDIIQYEHMRAAGTAS